MGGVLIRDFVGIMLKKSQFLGATEMDALAPSTCKGRPNGLHSLNRV